MAHPPFKSPCRLAPRPRPRTVAASRPSLRRCDQANKPAAQPSSSDLIPHPPSDCKKPSDYYGTPAFPAAERPLFHLKRNAGSNSDLAGKDMYECTFQPVQKARAEDILRELLQGHEELRAKVESQEQVLFELCGGVVPSLRLRSRESGGRPVASALSARRAQSSLSSVGLRPSSERPSALEDSGKHTGQRGASQNSVRRPVWRRRLKTDRENLDSVGSSLFIYPSSEGVFPVVGVEDGAGSGQKRYRSAPRPARFPKEVFPMVVRPRPMLD